MYTKLPNVAILVALLKKHGVRHVVLSAGTRQVPFARSVENDPFFTTYSVVDERGAAYFALGIAKETGLPVAISCTSSTATCNYLPAVAEAAYLHLPLLVLTGDRDARLLDQMEDQMIPQVGMYTRFCKKAVDLPPIAPSMPRDDVWHCARLVNEAILASLHPSPGPVQINYRIVAPINDIADASAPELPDVRPIALHSLADDPGTWTAKARELLAARRILVVAGLRHAHSPALVSALKDFLARYNALLMVENVSNLRFDGSHNLSLAAQALDPAAFRDHLPDVVVTFGGNFTSTVKPKLRVNAGAFAHWAIEPDGSVHDGFKSLTDVFACTPEIFFRRFADAAPSSARNDRAYESLWLSTAKAVQLPPIPYSNAYAITETVRRLPPDALLHTGILHSTRIMEWIRVPDDALVHCNLGTDGIDGTLSTFLGQAAVSPRPAYLILGDLSFFYDMNAVRIRHVGPNVRILLVNNGGGAEFHFSMGKARIPTIEQSISAGHHATAEAWVRSLGFRYLSARDQASFDSQIDAFMDPSTPGPALFEVFTEKESDGALVRRIYSDIRKGISPAVAPAALVDALAAKAPKTMETAAKIKDAIFHAIRRH